MKWKVIVVNVDRLKRRSIHRIVEAANVCITPLIIVRTWNDLTMQNTKMPSPSHNIHTYNHTTLTYHIIHAIQSHKHIHVYALLISLYALYFSLVTYTCYTIFFYFRCVSIVHCLSSQNDRVWKKYIYTFIKAMDMILYSEDAGKSRIPQKGPHGSRHIHIIIS